MTSQGALRAGAGLVEVFVPEEIYEIVAGAAPMESMVKPLKSYRDLLKQKVDVWAVGPGLGKSRAAEILELIEKAKQPMVIDADGLEYFGGKNLHAQTLQRQTVAHAASRRDETTVARRKRDARQNGDEILPAFSGNAFIERQPNDCGRTGSAAKLQHDRQSGNGHGRNGRHSHRSLRRIGGTRFVSL